MRQVEQNLIDFFAREKKQILQESLQRRICDQLNNINLQLQLSLSALLLPEEELGQRIEQFRQSLPDVEREKQSAKDVLSGDLKRIFERLSKEVELVRLQAKEKIIVAINKILQGGVYLSRNLSDKFIERFLAVLLFGNPGDFPDITHNMVRRHYFLGFQFFAQLQGLGC